MPCLLNEDSIYTSWITKKKTVMGDWNELKTIKSSNKCIIDTKQFTSNVACCIYCMWHNEINERAKLLAKQLKAAHNASHVKIFANRLYRVTVLYSLYYAKLKQTHKSYSFIIFL